jgi:NADH-quinone oxidoreductase subunit N
VPTDATYYLSNETIYCLLPEMLLAAVATSIFVGGAVLGGRGIWSVVAAGGVLAAMFALYRQYTGLHWAQADATEPLLSVQVGGPLAVDLLGQYVRWLVLIVGLLFVLITASSAAHVQAPEYAGSLLVAITGLMLVGTANELVLLFVSLELISIPTYVLLYLGRRDMASQEAATKYFFLSILSSALMLYGFSFLYGATGSTQLTAVRAALFATSAASGSLVFARLALVFIVAGLGFKLALVPFHFYAPDVYQGTTNGNAGLLAALPKIAAIIALVRIVVVAMPGAEAYGWRLALILSLATMTLGNVLALWQDNVRRLLAYSSIAHGGYMLIGLAAAFASVGPAGDVDAATRIDGVAATLFYLAVYVLATTGTFAALAYLGRGERQIDGVDELAGLGRTHPIAALAVATFMFSLAGIPPLAGFWGKFTLFASALQVDAAGADPSPLRLWFLGLAVVGVVNAAIAAAYYLRIVSVMYFRAPLATPRAQGGLGAGLAMLFCAVLVVVAGLMPDLLLRGASSASQSARAPIHEAAPALAAKD